jgi:hypothetical protein
MTYGRRRHVFQRNLIRIINPGGIRVRYPVIQQSVRSNYTPNEVPTDVQKISAVNSK